MSKHVTMPATKAKSKVTRTPRRKDCPQCFRYSEELLALACALERAELERDVMLDVMAKALAHADCLYQGLFEDLVITCKDTSWLVRDLQLVQAGCTRELGGSVWVRGEQIAECLNRYTNGRCVK